ncbi:MAG: methyltransferase domain-containing protein [Pseudomonadota bacterium]
MFHPSHTNSVTQTTHNWHLDPPTVNMVSTWIGSWHFSIRRKMIDEQRLARKYDRQSKGWAKRLHRLSIQHAYEKILSDAFSRESLAPSITPINVLDAGIGAGDLSLAYAAAVDETANFEGFDSSSGMLAEAKRQLRERGLDPLLHQANAIKLPFQDDQFDLVMTAHMLEHVQQPTAALDELIRVLKPGGRLIAFITRKSVLGFGIQLKWRVHAITPVAARQWMSARGLDDVHLVEKTDRSLLDQLSVVCVGQKPIASVPSRSTPRTLTEIKS